jgi:hypothetical protein
VAGYPFRTGAGTDRSGGFPAACAGQDGAVPCAAQRPSRSSLNPVNRMTTDPTRESEQPDAATSPGSVPHALQTGAADARKKANEVVASSKETMGRALYGACYYVSYAVCFPTFLIASLVPKDSAFARGMADGASSAQQSVVELHARRAARRMARAAARAESEIIEEGVESLATT